MKPEQAVDQVEGCYLQAVYELANGCAKTAVSLDEIQEYLACSDDYSERCCDNWTRRGVLEWPARGHVALTHLGLACAKAIVDDHGSGPASSPRRPPN
jgi:hypothetical protein